MDHGFNLERAGRASVWDKTATRTHSTETLQCGGEMDPCVIVGKIMDYSQYWVSAQPQN